MTRKKTAPTVPGLRLTLGGAPSSPHMIPGLPGFYRPDQPTPVGGPGECSLDRARQAAADPGIPVELVEIPASDVDRLRREQAEQRQAAAAAVRRQRRHGAVVPDERLTDEQAAADGEPTGGQGDQTDPETAGDGQEG